MGECMGMIVYSASAGIRLGTKGVQYPCFGGKRSYEFVRAGVSLGNETAKDLWDAFERQMRGSECGEQDRKSAILYEYETFKAIEGEQLLNTYLCYLQVINDLKKCGYKKDNCELNYKLLNNLQQEWKQYATMMRQTKNLMNINIDALYNTLKQNHGDVNDALGYKKKAVVVTSDPLTLVAEKTKVSKRKEKVVVSSDSEGSGADDFSELKKITALLAKAFNRRNFYSKPTNNNLRTSSTSQFANKKQEFVKSDDKKEDKKADEKKRDMSKVKCYNCKKEGHFSKDCKKAKIKDYNYYKTKMLLAKKDSDEQVLLESNESSSSAEESIAEVAYYTSESESESEFETLEYYDNFTNYGLFVNNDDDQEIFHDLIESASENFIKNHIDSQKDYDKYEVDHNDSEEKEHLVEKLIRKFNHNIVKCQKRIEKANQQSKDLENQNKGKRHCVLVPAFWFLRFVSCDLVLRFGHAFCLKISCVLPKDKLRFDVKHVAFCLKARCVFASRHAAFYFKTCCVFLQDTLRFTSRHLAFCFKTLAFCLKILAFCLMVALRFFYF
nr:hypothetical protein [Tanacetum cinerariifolium]